MNRLHAAAAWYLDLIASHGPAVLMAAICAQLAVILAVSCGLGILHCLAEQRSYRRHGIQRLEAYANHPANRTRREEKP